MNKFKIGDVVRRIYPPDNSDNDKNMYVNGIYTVIDVIGDVYIIVNGSDWKWLSHKFELIPQQEIIELI